MEQLDSRGDGTALERTLADAIAGEGSVDFDDHALVVFAHQFERNAPYRSFCLRRGCTPATVRRWRDIPAVPTAAFKIVELTCGPAERVFRTSGTTRGPDARGRHAIPCLDLYRAAALRHFRACVAREGRHAPVLALTPPPSERPDSSLVQMVEWIREVYGTDESAYFIHRGALAAEALHAALTAAAGDGLPCYLIGLTAAFEELFSRCSAEQRRYRLPYGTLVIDTGGHKGPATERPAHRHPLSRPGFLAACWRFLNVPGYHCINEYGMTELCSQFYDNVLHERVAGRLGPRHKIGPPWTRSIVVHPETLEDVPAGAPGLLRHYDLANCGSVLAVQTEDVGVCVGSGFVVHGRLAGAEPRGCALLLEDIASGHADCVASPSRSD